MPHEKSAMVKMRVKVSILETINAAAKQAGMNRSRFLRAAALAFDPEPVQPAQPSRKPEPSLQRAQPERPVSPPVRPVIEPSFGCPICGALGGTHQKGCARGLQSRQMPKLVNTDRGGGGE